VTLDTILAAAWWLAAFVFLLALYVAAAIVGVYIWRAHRWANRKLAQWLGLLALALLPAAARAEEPFVDRPSMVARALIYGGAVAGDAGTTLWARYQGAMECTPGVQAQGVMLASRAALGAALAWLDGRLPSFWRWFLRGATLAAYGWQAWKNYRVGEAAGNLSRAP
jgi:hypothetical protein